MEGLEGARHSAEIYLQRISRDMRELLLLTREMVRFTREAETEIPERVRRFMNYMHDIHDIKYMYEELGHQVPQHHLREMERCDDRFRQIVEELHRPGEAFEKIRREMAEDPENKWDHTRQLQFKGKSEKL
jgi:hypothetical protein